MRALAQRTQVGPKSGSFADRVARNAESASLIICAMLGMFHGWIERYAMNPDGMSYLDMGDALFRRDWAVAINAYWSPLYPALLGATMRLLRPPPRWEFPAVQFLNFLVYLAALLCFRFLLRSLRLTARLHSNSSQEARCPPPSWATCAIGYGLFLWASLDLITIRSVSPDMLVAAAVYLIAGLLIRLEEAPTWGRYFALGAVLGIAYWAKAVMFVLGFLFLAIALSAVRPRRKRFVGVLLAAVVFLSVCAPWVSLISSAKGHFTFGESGKLNYAWMVSPGSFWRNWQGMPTGSGVPRHPTRQLLADPPLFEFNGPVKGTYPVWYDPTYWNDGLQPHFQLHAQLMVLKSSALVYMRLLLHEQPGLLCGIVVLLLMSAFSYVRTLRSKWPLIAMAVIPMGLYALVHVDDRYVAAYVVLLWMAILTSVLLPSQEAAIGVVNYVGVAIIVTLALSASYSAVSAVMHPEIYSAFSDVKVAEAMQEMGLRTGDPVAIIGDGTGAFWARLARLRIVAEIMSGKAPAFWASSAERKQLVYSTFARTGAKVIVSPEIPPCGIKSGWQAIPGTSYYTYSLTNDRR